jgi:hypothetical protein
MVSLFVLLKNGEALFMCAGKLFENNLDFLRFNPKKSLNLVPYKFKSFSGTLLTPNIAVTAAHCFTNNEKQTTW